MRQLLYAMQFQGSGGPTDDPNVLTASMSAPSTRLTSEIDASGINSRVEPANGEPATFTSEVRLAGGTSFAETGTITSNFTFSSAGEVTDNQFGVIWVP